MGVGKSSQAAAGFRWSVLGRHRQADADPISPGQRADAGQSARGEILRGDGAGAMTGTVLRRGMPMSAGAVPLGDFVRRLLLYIFVAIVYLSMFGIRVLPDFSVSFS